VGVREGLQSRAGVAEGVGSWAWNGATFLGQVTVGLGLS